MNSTCIFEKGFFEPLYLVEEIGQIPRFYQGNGVNEVASHLENGLNRLLIKSPTGTGKTLIAKLITISSRVRAAMGLEGSKKMRVLFISNKHRLNRQALANFADMETVEFYVHSAFSEIPQHLINEGWDMTILDECHHEAMFSIQMLLNELTHRPMIGLTADDSRADGLLLKFEAVVTCITEKEAAELGFTAAVGVNSIIDTGKTDKTELTCAALSRYHPHMGNTIIFMRTEAEVKRVYRHLTRVLRLNAAQLGSKSSEADLDAAIDNLSSGKIQFIVNCSKIGEGMDAKNITDIFTARNFNSEQEKKQFIGRGIRPDSPCAVWELVNPLVDSVIAKDVVGLIKYERMICIRHGQWHEKLLSGRDDTWGQMSSIRFLPDVEKHQDARKVEKAGLVAA